MDPSGGILTSLSVAVERARSLPEPPIETVQFWSELLNEAVEARERCSRFEAPLRHELGVLIAALEAEVARVPRPPLVPAPARI